MSQSDNPRESSSCDESSESSCEECEECDENIIMYGVSVDPIKYVNYVTGKNYVNSVDDKFIEDLNNLTGEFTLSELDMVKAWPNGEQSLGFTLACALSVAVVYDETEPYSVVIGVPVIQCHPPRHSLQELPDFNQNFKNAKKVVKDAIKNFSNFDAKQFFVSTPTFWLLQ